MTALVTENLPLLVNTRTGLQRVRELILDLATRGRLVHQIHLSSSQDAQIAEPRLEAKKSQEFSRLSEQLPAGWRWVSLASIAELITSGSRDWAKHYATEGAIFVRMGNLSKDGYALRMDSVQRVRAPTSGEGRRTRLVAGDLLVSITGDVGMLGLIPEGFGEAYINQHTCLIRFQSEFKGRFFAEVLRSPLAKVQFNTPQRGIKNSFRLSDVGQIRVPLPPLEEQDRIVAKVDELMALCDRLEAEQADAEAAHAKLVEALLASLTQARDAADFRASWQQLTEHFHTLFITEASVDALEEAILELAVSGRLTEQRPSDGTSDGLIAEIDQHRASLVAEEGLRTGARSDIPLAERYLKVPVNWRYCRLGNLARFIDYRGKTPVKTDSGVPLITAKNVRFGYISREPREFIAPEGYVPWMTRGIPRPGDMLFTTEAPLGNIAIIDIAERFALAQRVICFQLHCMQTGPFLRIALMSKSVQAAIAEMATGMTATGVKASKLKELPIPLPPLAEQQRVVEKVEQLMELCACLRTEIANARQHHEHVASVLVEQAVA